MNTSYIICIYIYNCHTETNANCKSTMCFYCLVAKLCPTLVTPWTVAHQPPLVMGCPRQEYWSGLPFPSPRDIPNPVIEPASPSLAGGFFTTKSPRKPFN